MRPLAPLLIAAVLGIGCPPGAQAFERGVSAQGVAYLAGGADGADRRFLEAMRPEFGVWLLARDRATGEPIDGVHLRVIDARDRRLVFERTLDVPWLLLDVPPGRYQIEASFEGATRRWVVAPSGHGAAPVALAFDASG